MFNFNIAKKVLTLKVILRLIPAATSAAAATSSTGATPRFMQAKMKQNMAESNVAKSVDKATPTASRGETTSAAAAAAGKGRAENGESCRSCDKWKIPLLPQFQDVDERAEEFIAKFRNDRKLEREQSIMEFEEMLKRSA